MIMHQKRIAKTGIVCGFTVLLYVMIAVYLPTGEVMSDLNTLEQINWMMPMLLMAPIFAIITERFYMIDYEILDEICRRFKD